MLLRHHGLDGEAGGHAVSQESNDKNGTEWMIGDDGSAYVCTGAEFEAGVEMSHSDRRWFAPRVGEFLSGDPVENDVTNDYRYVGRMPENSPEY